MKEFPAGARFPAPFQCPADAVIRNVYYYSAARRPRGLCHRAGVYGGGGGQHCSSLYLGHFAAGPRGVGGGGYLGHCRPMWVRGGGGSEDARPRGRAPLDILSRKMSHPRGPGFRRPTQPLRGSAGDARDPEVVETYIPTTSDYPLL